MQDKNRFAATVSLAFIFLIVFFTKSIRAVPPQHESMLGSGSSGIQLAQSVEPPSPVKPPTTTGVLGDHMEPPSPVKPHATTGVSGSKPSAVKKMMFWQSIQGSKNPADFEAYLKKYPDGEFSSLAKNRLRALRKEKKAPVSLGVYTAVSRAPVRSEPRADADIVAHLRPGMKVRVVGQIGNYLEVRSKHGRAPGYVLQKDVALVPSR